MKKFIQAYLLFFFLITTLCTSSLARQGTGSINGKITDAQTGEPLPGASVTIEGTQTAVAADLSGHFTIRNVKSGSVTIRTSYLGYINETKQIAIESGTTVVVNFTLTASKNTLNEVIY